MTVDRFEQLKAQEDQLLTRQKALEEKIANVEKSVGEKMALLETVRAKREAVVPKSTYLATLFDDIYSQNVRIRQLTLQKGQLVMELESAKEQQLTALLKRLVGLHSPDIRLERIGLDEKKRVYHTKVSLAL